jgi:hypothetical protein
MTEPAEPGRLPATPCPFPEDFLAAGLYDPSVFLWNELVEIDPDASRVRARLTVDEQWPLVAAQRVDPVLHPRHMNGALMLHATASLGFAHAYWILGLRPADGWTGYGTHIHRAVFRQLVPAGGMIDGACEATRERSNGDQRFVRYRLEFRHDGKRCYEGDQTAVWIRARPDPVGALATPWSSV